MYTDTRRAHTHQRHCIAEKFVIGVPNMSGPQGAGECLLISHDGASYACLYVSKRDANMLIRACVCVCRHQHTNGILTVQRAIRTKPETACDIAPGCSSYVETARPPPYDTYRLRRSPTQPPAKSQRDIVSKTMNKDLAWYFYGILGSWCAVMCV